MSEIAAEVERMRRMTTAELRGRYRELWGKEPRVNNRTWLWKRCSWKLQEIRYGGLSDVARRRLEELIAEIDLPPGDGDRTVTGKLRAPRRPSDPPVGTTLSRAWKGRELRLDVREDGFELHGVLHPSLTAAARAATGSQWNGRLFWGLTSRKRR